MNYNDTTLDLSGDATGEQSLTLGLLNAVSANSEISQRTLSREMGVALGLANASIKRCIKKGLIKVQQAPSRRYAYYLTPKGFAEKSRLSVEFFRQSFNLFRQARSEFDQIVQECQRRRWTKVALLGVGELGEVALLSFSNSVRVVGFIDYHAPLTPVLGLPVARNLADLPAVDGVVVTALTNPLEAFEQISAQLPVEQIITPEFLHFVKSRPQILE